MNMDLRIEFVSRYAKVVEFDHFGKCALLTLQKVSAL